MEYQKTNCPVCKTKRIIKNTICPICLSKAYIYTEKPIVSDIIETEEKINLEQNSNPALAKKEKKKKRKSSKKTNSKIVKKTSRKSGKKTVKTKK